VQRLLIGRPGQEGTGAIPKDAIAELVPARGIADLLDGIKVRHISGGISTIGIKSYLRGRESFQGETSISFGSTKNLRPTCISKA
jgi:hypothetical protein